MRLRIFGREIAAVELDTTEATAEAKPPAMEAGSGHNFERDMTPADPTDRYREEFGFHPRSRR